VKHNLIAMPAAVTVWLAFLDRRALVAWLSLGIVFVFLAVGLGFAIFGREIFEQVLLQHRAYSLHRALSLLRRLKFFIPAALVAASAVDLYRTPESC